LADLQAALLVDGSERALFATERPGLGVLGAQGIVGRPWRELFAGFNEIEVESRSQPETFFFVKAGHPEAAYRVRRWQAVPVPGTGGGFFLLVDAIGDPTAVHELLYRERMVVLGQTAAGVAHELNNPLTTVSGWLQMLLAETPENDKARRPLEIMTEEIGRIASIVKRLLSFGRHTAPEHRPVRVDHLLRDVLAFLEYQMRNDNIEVLADFPEDLPPVTGDSDLLKQVFLNVIGNARQAMPRGGGLSVRAGLADDGHIEAVLADTGCGMSAEVQKRVFEPFYTTKSAAGGSGMGLFLCRTIVRDHGGTLTVSSRPGEGSVFIIRLPAAPQGVAQETGAPVAAVPPRLPTEARTSPRCPLE